MEDDDSLRERLSKHGLFSYDYTRGSGVLFLEVVTVCMVG